MKLVVAVVMLAACGGSQPAAPEPVASARPRPPADAVIDAPHAPKDAILVKMGEFRDEMCKCKDKLCADRVAEEVIRWAQEAAKSPQSPSKPSDEEAHEVVEIMEAYAKCMQKLMYASP